MTEPPKRQRKQPYNTLFLVNLPYLHDERPVLELFAEKYDVRHSYFPRSKQRGTFQGFGFVTLATEEECQDALEEFNNMMWMGRPIVVKWADNRKEKDDPNQFEDLSGDEDAPDEYKRRPELRYPPRVYRPPYDYVYPPPPPMRERDAYPPRNPYPPRERFYPPPEYRYDRYPGAWREEDYMPPPYPRPPRRAPK